MRIDMKLDGCKMSVFWANWLSGGYSAVIDLTKYLDAEGYFTKGMKATKRNDWRNSVKRGYRSRLMSWDERNERIPEIWEINISAKERQGRGMSIGYLKEPVRVGSWECEEHAGLFFGCFSPAGKLVAYIVVSPMGEIWWLSMIIGHKEYLKDFVMVNILVEVILTAYEQKIKYIGYHRFKNGTKGLQWWKESMGFEPKILEI